MGVPLLWRHRLRAQSLPSPDSSGYERAESSLERALIQRQCIRTWRRACEHRPSCGSDCLRVFKLNHDVVAATSSIFRQVYSRMSHCVFPRSVHGRGGFFFLKRMHAPAHVCAGVRFTRRLALRTLHALRVSHITFLRMELVRNIQNTEYNHSFMFAPCVTYSEACIWGS